MKWKCKPKPKAGERRQRVIFAIWPHKTTDGYLVWLEPVISEEWYGRYGRSWYRDKYLAIHDSKN